MDSGRSISIFHVELLRKRRFYMEERNFLCLAPTEQSRTVDDDILVLQQPTELFRGERTRKACPTATHQGIIGCLYAEIAVYLRAKEGQSRVFMAPFAVDLKDDGRNYLEPDIAVVCDEKKLDEEGCHGAPDWVIEVVSPFSRGMDYGRKLGAYIYAGVREYWIVDSEKKVIVTYYLEQPDVPVIYPFGDIVKSSIYNDLMIDTTQLEKIQYRKVTVRDSDREHEDVISALVVAVKKALDADGSAKRVPAELIQSVVSEALKAVSEKLESYPVEREEMKIEGQKRCDESMENFSGNIATVEEAKAYIESNYAELVASRNKGQIMKAVMGALKGRADSRLINEAVAELCR